MQAKTIQYDQVRPFFWRLGKRMMIIGNLGAYIEQTTDNIRDFCDQVVNLFICVESSHTYTDRRVCGILV